MLTAKAFVRVHYSSAEIDACDIDLMCPVRIRADLENEFVDHLPDLAVAGLSAVVSKSGTIRQVIAFANNHLTNADEPENFVKLRA